jgi:hypothetical protein
MEYFIQRLSFMRIIHAPNRALDLVIIEPQLPNLGKFTSALSNIPNERSRGLACMAVIRDLPLTL